MNTQQSHAAAWAAPLYSHLSAAAQDTKKTHKLAQMPCVLWLPEYRAYLRALNLCNASFTTSATAEAAMRLGEDQAVAVARDLIEVTGVRVHVRAFHPAH